MLVLDKKQLSEDKQGTALRLKENVNKRKLYLESYGCQMNFSDSEIVASVLGKNGFDTTPNIDHAD